jgi:hypothetical protein
MWPEPRRARGIDSIGGRASGLLARSGVAEDMRFELAGVPVLHEDDALRAVRAAADLLEEIAILNERLEAELGLAVSVRIGGEHRAGGN